MSAAGSMARADITCHATSPHASANAAYVHDHSVAWRCRAIEGSIRKGLLTKARSDPRFGGAYGPDRKRPGRVRVKQDRSNRAVPDSSRNGGAMLAGNVPRIPV